MRIVNTFISETNSIPEYTKLSLEQARKFNSSIPIDFISREPAYYFKDLDINWINQNDINKDQLNEFNKVSWLDKHGTPNTTYPSPEGFWSKTAERLFYLASYINDNRFKDVIHFENDVLIYGDLKEVKPNHGVVATTTSSFQTTFAFAYILNPEYYKFICENIIEIMKLGERRILSYGYDHVNEMCLLNMVYRNKLIGSFPTLPCDDSDWIFDPASYGQFLGGTNNGPGSGFTDPNHYIGSMINSGEIIAKFENGAPYACNLKTGNCNKIFNLHIHSKNLQGFI